MRVLGIDVASPLLDRWRGYLAPQAQPFFLGKNDARLKDFQKDALQRDGVPPDLRDTYYLWGLERGLQAVWLTRAGFVALPGLERVRLVRSQVALRRGAVPTVRAWADLLDPQLLRAQVDGHRFLWWPELVAGDDRVVARAVAREKGQTPSRHEEVAESTWRRCAELLPGVRELAGTFADGSGPNCFGTVMAALGGHDAAKGLTDRVAFLRRLRVSSRPGGRDDEPGTVFVWRDRAGAAQHAAVTLGDGWAFEKPSQCWWTPRQVRKVRELIAANRPPGLRMERHQLRGGAL